LVGKVPGTPEFRKPISKIPAVAGVGRPYSLYPKASVSPLRGKTKRPTNTKLGKKGRKKHIHVPWINNDSLCHCWLLIRVGYCCDILKRSLD